MVDLTYVTIHIDSRGYFIIALLPNLYAFVDLLTMLIVFILFDAYVLRYLYIVLCQVLLNLMLFHLSAIGIGSHSPVTKSEAFH